MNKLLTSLLLLLSLSPVFTQTTKDFFSTPNYEILMISIPSSADEFSDGNLSLYFEKDSLVCGESMLVYDTKHQGRVILDIIGGEVWAVHDCDDRKLVMNFDAVVGDTITHQNTLRTVVAVGDTILMDGLVRKTYQVDAEPNTSPSTELFIEGIGSIFVGLNYLTPDKEYTTYLSCVNDNQGLSYLSEFANPIICELYTRLISSTSDIPNFGMAVYPNPSSGIFTLEQFSGETLEANVYSSIGNLIYTSKISVSKSELDLTSLAKGQYFLELKNHKGQSDIQKIIIL